MRVCQWRERVMMKMTLGLAYTAMWGACDARNTKTPDFPSPHLQIPTTSGNWGPPRPISGLGCQGRVFPAESRINQLLISQQAWSFYLRLLFPQGRCQQSNGTPTHPQKNTHISLLEDVGPPKTLSPTTICPERGEKNPVSNMMYSAFLSVAAFSY